MGSKLSITKFSPLGLRTKLSAMALIFGCCPRLFVCHVAASGALEDEVFPEWNEHFPEHPTMKQKGTNDTTMSAQTMETKASFDQAFDKVFERWQAEELAQRQATKKTTKTEPVEEAATAGRSSTDSDTGGQEGAREARETPSFADGSAAPSVETRPVRPMSHTERIEWDKIRTQMYYSLIEEFKVLQDDAKVPDEVRILEKMKEIDILGLRFQKPRIEQRFRYPAVSPPSRSRRGAIERLQRGSTCNASSRLKRSKAPRGKRKQTGGTQDDEKVTTVEHDGKTFTFSADGGGF